MAIIPVGFTGTVGQVQFSQIMNLGDGVVSSWPNNSSLRVDRVVGQDRRVTVQTGAAKVPGARAEVDAVATYDFPPNASGLPRLDWLVLRFDWSTNPGTCTLVHVQGTPAANPQRPNVTQVNGVRWEVPLALVRVDAGVGAFPADAIADARYWDMDGVAAQQVRSIDPQWRPGRLFSVVSTGELFLSNGQAWLPVNRTRTTLAITMASGWGNFGGGYGPPEVDVWTDGTVQLRGLARRTGAGLVIDATGDQIGTMPAAGRPTGVRRSGLVNSHMGPMRLDVYPTGELMLQKNDGAVTLPTNGHVFLEPLSYRR